MSKKPISKKRSLTDFKRLDAMRDEDIDFSDIPPMTPEMFAKAVVRVGWKPVAPKQQITLRSMRTYWNGFAREGSGIRRK